MTDTKTEKFSEILTNAFKKTKVFEKIGKIEIYIGSFIVLSSIISLTSIYINYFTINKIKKLEDKIEASKNVLKHNIETNRQLNTSYNSKLSKQLKNQSEMLCDTQQKLTEKIIEIKSILPNSKKELISVSTSVSSLSPVKSVKSVKSVDSIDGWKDNIIQQENVKEMEDNELLNECYDTIPLNNLTKNTTGWLI
jgi:hypothetical protein